MTPTTFGSDSKRILIPCKPHENKRLHSDEMPSRSSHWWKGCARNHAGLRTSGGHSCCESKPQKPALYILLTIKAFTNLNFGYFCKKSKKERSPYIHIYGRCYFSFLFKIKFWHEPALLCCLCNYTQRYHWALHWPCWSSLSFLPDLLLCCLSSEYHSDDQLPLRISDWSKKTYSIFN